MPDHNKNFFAGGVAASGTNAIGVPGSFVQGDELPGAVANIITMPHICVSIENFSGTETVVWVRPIDQIFFTSRTQYKRVVIPDGQTYVGYFDLIKIDGAGTANYDVATVYYNQANPIR